MKTLFEPSAYQEILRRLDTIHANSPRQWGKMSVAQMLEHTARALEMAAGKIPGKQAPLGKVLGWAFRKGFVGPEPFRKNSPTGPHFVIKHEPELQATLDRLKSLLAEFHAMGEDAVHGNIHGFFGKMTGREWGTTQYKHVDHHLRQFGA